MAYDYFSPDGNATRSHSREPQFEMDEFWEDVEDENGNDWIAKIKMESYFYEGSLHLVRLQVSTSYPFTDEIQESVVNIIELRYGKSVTMDCEIELI